MKYYTNFGRWYDEELDIPVERGGKLCCMVHPCRKTIHYACHIAAHLSAALHLRRFLVNPIILGARVVMKSGRIGWHDPCSHWKGEILGKTRLIIWPRAGYLL